MPRRLPILDLYVLSLVDRGLHSMYEFQKIGGLSLGASTPAVRRLLKAKLLKRQVPQKVGKRVRFHFELTSAGKNEARHGWKDWIAEANLPADLDALLRVVDMALATGRSKGECSALLLQAANAKSKEGRRTAGPLPNIPYLYLFLRGYYESHKLSAEVAALREIAAKLEKASGISSPSLPSRKKASKRRT